MMIDAMVFEEDMIKDFDFSTIFVALHESFVSTTAAVEKGDCDEDGEDFGKVFKFPFSEDEVVRFSVVVCSSLLSCFVEGDADANDRIELNE